MSTGYNRHVGTAGPAAARKPAIPGRPHPHSYLRPAELRRLKNLLFTARTIIEGHYAGRHRSRSRGQSIEFADYREYCPGDEITDIDWKAYGRTDKLFVKLFEAQTDMVVYPMLDCSASMGYAGMGSFTPSVEGAEVPGFEPSPAPHHEGAAPPADGPLSKFEYACYLLAALAFLVIKQGDKVALGLFRERLDDFIAPGGTFQHLYDALNRLEHAVPSGRTDVPAALRHAFPTMRSRGLLVVVSDFLEEPAALFEALGLYRHRHFEIILFHVLHDEELHLPLAPNVRFVDSETGETIRTIPADIRQDYERRLNQHVDQLRRGCAARRIDYNLVTTATSYHSVLERYLVDRATAGA